MSRFIALAALCLALGGCVYYPYGYAPPRYRYAPAYGYAPPYGPAPAYPYAAPAQPYSAQPYSAYPQTTGPNGDTPGAVGGN